MSSGKAARMAKKKVRPINFSSAVDELLQKYGETVYDVLSESVDEVAQEAMEKLQDVSKFAPNGHPSGLYSASWTNVTWRKDRVATKTIVYNAEYYQLSHLLENGHVSSNGTHRVFGRVPGYPHIAPVNEWANKELPQLLERKLRKI